jgi:hypothetical protein
MPCSLFGGMYHLHLQGRSDTGWDVGKEGGQ